MNTEFDFYTDVTNYFDSLFVSYIVDKEISHFSVTSNNKVFCFYFLQENIQTFISYSTIIIHKDIWISRNKQVKSRLNSLLGINKKIHARQCICQTIDKGIAEYFLDENHISGYCKSAYKYGLYHKDKLVAVATFSKGRKMNRLNPIQRSFELLSFATISNYTIVGGFDKLVKYFTKIKKPDDIMTYVDLEWSNAETFTKLGFEIVGKSKPITFYIDEKFKRHTFKDGLEIKYEITNKGNLKLIKKLC